jgi:hypothetical protein
LSKQPLPALLQAIEREYQPVVSLLTLRVSMASTMSSVM